MKKITQLLLAAGLFANSSIINAAAPTSGAYIDDPVNTYVNDQALEPVETVNMIMCFMGSLRPEQKVGAGNYNALVDSAKCEGKGASGNSNSAGASAATDYVKVTVNSTRVDTSSPMLVKAWVNSIEDNGAATIYTYTTVTKGSSESAPNGNLTMKFAGYPVSSPTTNMFRGELVVGDSTITFTETSSQDGTMTRALTITPGDTSGSGRISQILTGSGQLGADAQQTYDIVFAYNSTHFTRKKGSAAQQCFSRSRDQADISVWRYGVYKNDGTRLSLANSGFPITYSSSGTTYWGYAGFYGIYFPDTALAAMGSSATVSSQDGATSYAYSKVGGKLSKMTKGRTTLGAIKGLEIGWVWLNECANNSSPCNQFSGATYNLKWNGTNLVKTQKQRPNGDWETANDAPVSASTQRDLNQMTLWGWSQALGGQVSIEVPSSGFTSSLDVYYRSRSTVSTAVAANLTLLCVSECLKKEADMLAALPSNEPFLTVGASTRNWSSVLMSDSKKYVFNAGMMYLGDTTSGNQVDASSSRFTTSGTDQIPAKLSGNYQWGLRTGTLVAALDPAGTPPNEVRCDANGNQDNTGSYICSQYFQDLTETYEWETGPQPWNQYATLTESGSSTPKTFDPPRHLNLTLSAVNTTLASTNEKIGSSIQLEYNGFGDLWGIPGSCYNPATNEKGPCDSSTYTNWAPEFSLKAGAEITETAGGITTTYYVKPIDQEIRFAKVADSNCSSLTLPTSASLPSLPSGDDAKTIIGDQPTVTAAPAVIHGVVQ